MTRKFIIYEACLEDLRDNLKYIQEDLLFMGTPEGAKLADKVEQIMEDLHKAAKEIKNQ